MDLIFNIVIMVFIQVQSLYTVDVHECNDASMQIRSHTQRMKIVLFL